MIYSCNKHVCSSDMICSLFVLVQPFSTTLRRTVSSITYYTCCFHINKICLRFPAGAPLVSVTTPAVPTWTPEVTQLPTSTTAFTLQQKTVPLGDVKDINNQRSDAAAPAINITKATKEMLAKMCGQNTPCADSNPKPTAVDGDTLGDRTRLSVTTTPHPLPSTTIRSIYIRGHLLASHRKRTFVPPLTKSESVHSPDTASRVHVTHFKNAPARKASYVAYVKKPSRRKKKHSSFESKRFDNFRFLHETVSVSNPLPCVVRSKQIWYLL